MSQRIAKAAIVYVNSINQQGQGEALQALCAAVAEDGRTLMCWPPLEPAAGADALMSAAISLRRIADVLSNPNEYGEVGGAAIARGIILGLRGRK